MVEATSSRLVIVHSLSRFFRDFLEFALYERKLLKAGVKVISITQQTSEDPAGEMARRIFSMFDEYQSKENAKHTLRAMKENARQGFFNGSRPPFGFKKEELDLVAAKGKKKRLVVDEAEAPVVRRVFDLYLHGLNGDEMGSKQIAAHFNERGPSLRGSKWTRTRVHNMLSDTAYMGEQSIGACDTPAVPVAKLDRAVLTALADKVLTPDRLREMLRELKTRLKKAQAGQDDQVRTLQRELAELEQATNRLYEAVEKGVLPMDDTLAARAQKLKARREGVLIEIAGARRAKEMPVAALSGAQLDAFSAALRSTLLEGSGSFPKRYLRQFVSDIRYDGKRVTMSGRKDAVLMAAAEKEMGTARVPTSGSSWLPDLGSNQGPTD